MKAATAPKIRSAIEDLTECYRSEGIALLAEGFSPVAIEATLRGSGVFGRGPFTPGHVVDDPDAFDVSVGSCGLSATPDAEAFLRPSPASRVAAARRQAPLEVVDHGAGDIRALLERSHVPVLQGDSSRRLVELPHRGLMTMSTGATAAELGEVWGADVVVVDLVVDGSTCTSIAVTAHPQCNPLVVDCAVGLLQSAGLEVYVTPDSPGLVVARTVAVLANRAAELMHGVPHLLGEQLPQALSWNLMTNRGPLEAAWSLGASRIVEIVSSLQTWYGPTAYHPAPSLRRESLRIAPPDPAYATS